MRPLVPVLVALLLAGCTDPYAREPDDVTADEWSLEPGSFFQPTFETGGNAHVRATVEVREGDAIDVFLASGAECRDYPTGDFAPAATLLSTRNGTLEADLPAGQACLVLDNHDSPIGASPGNGTARVAYRIQVWR